jgi:tellurite resistance protein
MKIKIDNTVLQEAIRVVSRLAPPVSGNIVIKTDGKKAWMQSTAEISRCSVLMPSTVSGENLFAISLNTLRDATKGRKELEIHYDKTLCKISASNYKCELATVDALEVEADKDTSKGEAIKLNSEQAEWLKSAVNTVALKPNALLNTFMPVAIRLTNKSAFVACYDRDHIAYVNSKEITGDMSIVLPFDTATAVLDVFHKAPFKLELGSSNLHVTNALVRASLSLPQEDEESAIGLDAVVTQSKAASKADGAQVEIEKAALLEFLDNARAVATKERSEIAITTDKGKVKFEIVTANGSTRTVLKAACTTQTKAKVDFEFLDEAVRKCAGSVVMKIVNDAFINFQMKNSAVIVSLNQD